MTREYQIKERRTKKEFREWAQENDAPIQLALPATELLGCVEKGLGELIRKVGKLFIESILEAEVERLAGKRSKPNTERSAYRWGAERGYCVVDGEKMPIRRPRVRSCSGGEIALGSYQIFQQATLVSDTVWANIMRGLSTRNYKEVLQRFSDAYGLEKTTISERFIEASRQKLEMLMKRSLTHLQICVLLVDGTIFKGQNLIVAIGIDGLGAKTVLGIVQGASESAAAVNGLFQQLQQRGLDFDTPRLYLIDGGKALRSAIHRHAGDKAFVQRCQVHKIRNVTEYLPPEERPSIKFRMRAAYSKPEVADARRALHQLHDHLMNLNPSAADSLAEGLEDTLTLHELGVHSRLRSSFSSTNCIESSFSVVEKICKQVKRWQGSDHRLRWVASAMVYVESRWNRIHGYRQMPLLITQLQRAYQLRCSTPTRSAGVA